MKRVWIAIVVVFVALAGLAVWWAARPSDEPVYKGKTLTSWLSADPGPVWTSYGGPGPYVSFPQKQYAINPEARLAVEEAGTNAIPTLLRLLRKSDSPLRNKLAGLLQRQHVIRTDYMPAAVWNHRAAIAFRSLKANGEDAVPSLIRILNGENSLESRCAAIEALCWIGPSAKEAVPALLRWATNGPTPQMHWYTNAGRAEYGWQWPTNTEGKLQWNARGALPRIDPGAASDAGVTDWPGELVRRKTGG